MIGTFRAGRPAGAAHRATPGRFRSEKTDGRGRTARRQAVIESYFVLSSPVEPVSFSRDQIESVRVFGIWLQSGRKQRER